jgi:hypothetical protein
VSPFLLSCVLLLTQDQVMEGAPTRPAGRIASVAADRLHRFSKSVCPAISIIAGLGVAGDAHAGSTVQHRSRLGIAPAPPNLRQVHLIHGELLDALAQEGFAVAPGQLGENMLTTGIDLLALPRHTRLAIGDHVVLEVSGLRNPCAQIEAFRPGLLARLAGPAGSQAL